MTDFKILKYQDANMQNHEALARMGLLLMAIYNCKLTNKFDRNLGSQTVFCNWAEILSISWEITEEIYLIIKLREPHCGLAIIVEVTL